MTNDDVGTLGFSWLSRFNSRGALSLAYKRRQLRLLCVRRTVKPCSPQSRSHRSKRSSNPSAPVNDVSTPLIASLPRGVS
jgi:hypothetical protein